MYVGEFLEMERIQRLCEYHGEAKHQIKNINTLVDGGYDLFLAIQDIDGKVLPGFHLTRKQSARILDMLADDLEEDELEIRKQMDKYRVYYD